eukprot:CAMPEP_0183735516 /NCGR_PEP_ID=MMETSP0737-20130205/46882_1 /TAXON_ID=385413 /ORGANISM="Thalassiosira miniscula, Strain CCMP1093" /LENGTH=253 /DNA_ID=CAMNT_0025969281 /DNA_START=60 /DNA_END=821 /DNA_ORIENTATION=-
MPRNNYPSSLSSRWQWQGWAISITIFIFIIVCVKPPPSESDKSTTTVERISLQTPKEKTLGSGDVLVKCDLATPFDDENGESSANGTLEIAVHQSLAPLASNAFLDMVRAHHFDHIYLFRAVKGFIVQWGIESPKPAGEASNKVKFPKVGIDPPPADKGDTLRSNVRGALNFAGGNSKTGQVYINRANNPHLDKEPGSLPFASLDEASMAIVDSVYSYKEGLGQVKAVKKGDDEVRRLFPRMSRIERCWIVDG